jgi:hypothetical protein
VDDVTTLKTLEPLVDHAIRVVGGGIAIFGVLDIVTGIARSTVRQLRQRISTRIRRSTRSASVAPSCLASRCWWPPIL